MFQEHSLDRQKPAPNKYHYLQVTSVFFHKRNYIAFYKECTYVEKKHMSQDFCLIFDENGNVLQRIEFLKDKNMAFFDLSKDGYLIGTDRDAEMAKIFIYRLEKNESPKKTPTPKK